MSSTERTYQPGQKVVVVNAEQALGEYHNGDVLTVKSVGPHSLRVEEFEIPGLFFSEVQPYQPEADKDVITIQRSELPEVREVDGDLWVGNICYSRHTPAAEHRQFALNQLAVSEALAAKEEAEQVRKAEEAKWEERKADFLWMDKPALIQHIIDTEKAAEKGETK